MRRQHESLAIQVVEGEDGALQQRQQRDAGGVLVVLILLDAFFTASRRAGSASNCSASAWIRLPWMMRNIKSASIDRVASGIAGVGTIVPGVSRCCNAAAEMFAAYRRRRAPARRRPTPVL